MRKLIYLLIAFTALTIQSCNSCQSDSTKSESNDLKDLVYNVTATAEGQVEFSWFNGGASIDGNAVVYQCNDSTKLLSSVENATSLQSALSSKDVEVKESAEAVFGLLKVKGIEGNYHLTIKGYVKYGPLYFMIDEEYPKDSIE